MKITKKILSIFLSVLMLFTNFISMTPIDTYAATIVDIGKKVSLGELNTNYKFTFNGSTRTFYINQVKSNGYYCYCLQWSVDGHAASPTATKVSTSSVWKGLGSTKQNAIAKASMYGWPNYTYGVSKKAAATATQMIINEFEKGWRTKVVKGDYSNGLIATSKDKNSHCLYDCAKNYEDLWTAYKGIINNMAQHDVVPSFNGDKVTLKYDAKSGTYKATLTDSKKVLKDFVVKSGNSNVKVTVKDNVLTLTSSKAVSNVKISMTKKGTSPDTLSTSPKCGEGVLLYQSASTQTTLYGTVCDPVTASTTVSTEPDATIALTKVCTESGCTKHVSGITFTVTCSALGYTKTVKTDANGKFTLTGLHPGTYVVKETLPADCSNPSITYDGATTTAVSKSITIKAGDNAAVKFTNHPVFGSITVTKIDQNTNEKLTGVEFKLYNSAGALVATKTTDAAGVVKFTNLPVGSYTLRETKSLEGYFTTFTSKNISVTKSVPNTSVTVTNTAFEPDPEGEVYVFKSDSVTGRPLEGAEFEIYANEDIKVDGVLHNKDQKIINRTIKTDITGFGVVSKPLPPGKYYIVETKAPVGSVIDTTPHYFEITDDSEKPIFTPNTNVDLGDANDYIDYKTPEHLVPAISCDCCADCANTADCNCQHIEETDPETGLPIPQTECTCAAQAALQYYEKVDYDYGKATVTVQNSKSSTNKISGATVSCYYMNGDEKVLVGTGITDTTGTITFNNLAVDKKYAFIQQENFNNSFIVNPTVNYIQLATAGQTSTLTIANDIDTSKSFAYSKTQLDVTDDPITVKLHKVETDTNKPLAGALLFVYNEDGDVYDCGITDENGEFVMTNIPAGTYTFTENKAPDGYIKSDQTYTFAVDEKGVITGTTVVEDKITTVTLHKSDVTTSEGVPGAHITVWDEDENIVFEGTTDPDGVTEIKGLVPGTYTFREVVAPQGYIINTAIFNFTLYDDGTVEGDDTVSDEPTSVTIIKGDEETFEPLKGVVFEFFDEEGNSIGTHETDENGEITFTRLPIGTYTYKEVKTIPGYAVSNEVYTFTINEDGTVDGTVIVGNKQTVVVISKIDADTSDALANAKIQVYDENKNIAFEGLTNEYGELTIVGLPCGKYTFKEVAAPSGYALNEKEYSFTIEEDGTVTGDNCIKDSKTHVVIKKIDAETNEPMQGVEFEFFDPDGNSLGLFETDENGEIEFEGIEVGTYTFIERRTLDGYILDKSTYSFTIAENGDVTGDVLVTNSKIPAKPPVKNPPVKTGDNLTTPILGAALIVSGICLLRKRKTK